MKKTFVFALAVLAVFLLAFSYITFAQAQGKGSQAIETPPAPRDPASSAAPSSSAAPASGPLHTGALFEEKAPEVLAPAPYNHVISFAGSALRPRENDVSYVAMSGGGCVYASAGDSWEVWNVPVTLPEGAQVQWLRYMYYNNTGAAVDSYAWLTEYNSQGAVVNEWGGRMTNTGYGYTDIQITPAEPLDYWYSTYLVNWRPFTLGPNVQLCGVRLYYYVPYNTFAPSIFR